MNNPADQVKKVNQGGARTTRHGWTIADEVFATLRKRILTGAYLPGDRLRPSQLSTEQGASSTVIREALMRLVAVGLVQSQPQQGFAVITMEENELRDLTAMRILIESEGLRGSIRRGGVLWQSRVVAAHHVLVNTNEATRGKFDGAGVARQDAHTDFHHALVSGCGSQRLITMSKTLYGASELYRRLSRPLDTGVRDCGVEHQAIMDAALLGDEQLAVAKLEEHYNHTVEVLVNSHMLRAKS